MENELSLFEQPETKSRIEDKELVAILQNSQKANLSVVEANRKLQQVIDSLLPDAQAFREFYSKSGNLSMKEVSDRIPNLPNGETNSNQKILKMLCNLGDIKSGYYGYETLAQGRSRGLITKESFDPSGRKHTSVLATQDGFLYIGRAIKRYYGVAK